MDPLTLQLMQRQLAQWQAPPPQVAVPPQVPPQPGGLPQTPPDGSTKVPPEAQRWENAQQIENAYRGGWQTNPVLLRASLGHR